MVLEHAVLSVIPDREADFEAAFGHAKSIISSMHGFVSLQLLRCIEEPNRYLLLVEWDQLEDHTEGFRGSDQYQEWKTLLHHFYDPFPTVDHYNMTVEIAVPANAPSPTETALLYFELSNMSDFAGIEQLLTDTTTYSSQNTGIYFGSKDILAMQRAYHGKFTSLNWSTNSVDEVKPGVVLVDFDFTGQTSDGETVQLCGFEYVIANNGKIQHIEIRNK